MKNLISQEKIDQMSLLIRNMEAELGTTEMMRIMIDQVSGASDYFKVESVDEFFEAFEHLMMLVKSTKPKIGILIYYFCEIWDRLAESKNKFKSVENIKSELKKITAGILTENANDNENLVKNGVECVKKGDKILVHSHSRVVLKVLVAAKKKKIDFSVVVAEQNEEKTDDIIEFLQENDIEFTVVPEFMLSHLEKEITKVFLGCVTFNDDHEFIADAGTNSVVSEFHHVSIPVYMFVTTKKFALWKSPDKEHSHKVVQKNKYKSVKKLISYDRIKFSHDRISLGLLDNVVTEQGVFLPKNTGILFDKMLKERGEWIERHFSKKL